jgi:hypothetical protein
MRRSEPLDSLASENWYEIASGARVGQFTLGSRAKIIAIALGRIVALNLHAS